MSGQHPAVAETGPNRHKKGLRLGSNPQDRSVTSAPRVFCYLLCPYRVEMNPDWEKVDPVILNQYFMNAALFMARAKVIMSCGKTEAPTCRACS